MSQSKISHFSSEQVKFEKDTFKIKLKCLMNQSLNLHPLWKVRRALGDFLYFSAPQRVLLQFVVRGNLLDGLANTRFTPKSLLSHTAVPPCFPQCHPLSPPRTPHVTPPTPVGPCTPPAAHKQVSHRRFRLWSAPNPASAPRCSPLLVAPPQYTLNPRSAVGREPQCPPMPGFPRSKLFRTLRIRSTFLRFPAPQKARLSTNAPPLSSACLLASAPRAFRIIREHSARPQTNRPKLWPRRAPVATP
ncbi:hypothetical protein PGTUg99_018990 [Puccinia graminis f. sp. tritici]|uniref:Uncharacterized protein n=1 Tax=Puccinia graminis f. sp. tritici TaxID=56615 RepID=A0A5B0RFS7_PUCGR|nr:hypothetical protein PGTUg99_018990 [Puccinia graminis f. sp. tritici]